MLSGMQFDAVVFDVGETVLDPSREYQAWAAFFGVPAHTFSAVFGAMIAQGATVQAVLERFGSGRSVAELWQQRGGAVRLGELDLYPDVRPALAALAGIRGLQRAIAGNQHASVAGQLRRLQLDVELLAASGEWGVAKPDPAFFGRLCQELGLPPQRVVYVGDQLDNDVRAPIAAGLAAIRIRRGPWGWLTADPVLESSAVAVIDSLLELPALLS